jgi:hypothetical protein
MATRIHSAMAAGIIGVLLAVLALPGQCEARVTDPLTITADPTTAPPGTQIVFRIYPKVQSAGDTVSFDFGDGGKSTLEYNSGCSVIGGCDSVEHAYAGAGTFTVTASGTITGRSVSGTVKVTISTPPPDTVFYVATSAHIPGYGGTNWRTDLEINNQGLRLASYEISVLLRNQDNSNPQKTSFALAPRQSAHYGDILQSVFGLANNSAALRIKQVSGTIMVTSRTYNQLAVGTYGQYVPAIAITNAIPYARNARIIGLSHDPSGTAGYRTNIGFVNATPAPIAVEVTFYAASGLALAIRTYDLQPYEYRQRDKIFELDNVTTDPVEYGFVEVRTTTVGGQFYAYASVVDNVTGDPIYVPAQLVEAASQ